MEMSFVDVEDIIVIFEEVLIELWVLIGYWILMFILWIGYVEVMC